MAKSVYESDFNTFVKKNIKPQLETKKRINKMILLKKYLNDKYLLGKGTRAKVYKVK